MPMPKQLAQVAIFRARCPHAREAVFQHQFQDMIGNTTVSFLPPHTRGLYLRWIAHPQLLVQLC
jgi:hypothetical protein